MSAPDAVGDDALPSPRLAKAVSDPTTASTGFSAGTIDECLAWLTALPEASFLSEASFFVYAFAAFAPPSALLSAVAARAESAREDSESSRLFEFVHVWVKLRPVDELLPQLLALPRLPVAVANAVKLAMLRKRPLSPSQDAAAARATQGFGNMVRQDWTSRQLAEQLTLLESQLFQALTFDELLEYATAGEDRKGACGAHLAALAARFNAVSYWVATQVLVRGVDSVEKRAHELERFIDVMVALRAMHNYNGLMAVLAGLNNAAVTRLKDEWARVAPDRRAAFAAVEGLMEPTRNFAVYRRELAQQAAAGDGPLVPYLAVHLRDLLFIELGNVAPAEGCVSYHKVQLLGRALSQLCFYQRHAYVLQPDAELLQYLRDPQHLSEDQLHARSVEIRPLDESSDAAAAAAAVAPINTAAAAAGPSYGLSLLSPRKSPRSGETGSESILAFLSPRAKLVEGPKVVNPVFGVDFKKSAAWKSSEALDRLTQKGKEKTAAAAAAPVAAAAAAAPAADNGTAAVEHAPPVDAMRGSKQSMTRDGQFLMIPTTEADSVAFARATNDAGLQWLVSECERRNMIMPQSHYVRFFVVNHCNEKKALRHAVDYWAYYSSIGFKNIVAVDVSAALSSHVISPPLTDDWFDMEGRPTVLMRANLWFEGDEGAPTVEDLKLVLMYIGELLARTVQYHYTGFTFIMDMQDWQKRNFSTNVYTQLITMIADVMPIRCERFIFVDVPKIFAASWKLVSTSLRPDFKKRMIISTREDMRERLVDAVCLPTDLGGTLPTSDVAGYIALRKREELPRAIAPPPTDRKPELSPVLEVVDDDPSHRHGVYALRIQGRRSSVSMPKPDLGGGVSAAAASASAPDKKLLTKGAKGLDFFKKKK